MRDNAVIFLKDWSLLVSSLSNENQLVFWQMFSNYEFGLDQKCTNDFVAPIWNFVKSQMDNMKKKYNDRVVQRNKTNGAKGGRPKKETQENPNNPVGFLETKPEPKKPKEKKIVEPEIKLIIPEDFITIWDEWLEYRKAKKKKPYAGIKWEQIALDKFLENSKNNAEIGRAILNQTITHNWEGLFELKDNKVVTNGKSTNTNGKSEPVAGRQSAETIANNLQGWE